MKTIIVASRPEDWPLEISGVEVVPARDYLTDSTWSKQRRVRVYNLCGSYRYQTEGYYVSLLGTARRHKPFPDLMTVLDMRSRALVRTADEELDDLIQSSLAEIRSDEFVLSIYFGRNLAKRHARLAARLFASFPSPLLRASFRRGERWRLTSVGPLAIRDVPDSHRDFLKEAATEYFARPRYRARARRASRYDLAILRDPDEVLAPSDDKAIAHFTEAAEKLGFGVEQVGREDYGRLAEFDALFIRETTAVNHHTFRFAQRAEAEGLVVIDDPESILRCTNKVFQAESFEVHGVPTPKTWITDRIDAAEIERRIGLPCVLKYPDSSFSRGVLRCDTREELELQAGQAIRESDLLLVQEYLPSEFDWRIGLFGGEVLYACRYLMARGHWQIVKKTESGRYRYGRVEPVPLEETPEGLLDVARRAAATIGDGLYGVDLKTLGDRIVVTEVNDNPNIDAGCEDALLKKELYARIMRGFLERVEARKRP